MRCGSIIWGMGRRGGEVKWTEVEATIIMYGWIGMGVYGVLRILGGYTVILPSK